MSKDLVGLAKDLGIKYFLISYTDLFGNQRAKLVPASAIGGMVKAGASFAGFATWLDMSPAHPDLFAIPDPDSLIQLPWKPEVGWLAADLWMDGKEVEQGPRNTLKRVLASAKADGYEIKTGVECEFFLVTPDGKSIADAADSAEKPCYDQSALMRRYDVITEICDAMLALGWKPYQNDHEDANGQFEMNWEYDNALVTADRHSFFKFMAKSVAEKHGLRATFMPKPFANLTGSGCHTHVSLWKGKHNLFEDPKGELGVSQLGYHFIGGLINSADAVCAITNPTVNSYKRINAPRTISGATWAPNTVTYSGNNRTHMVRIPEAGRFEFRLPDGAVNPYLLQAAVGVAGMDGIREQRNPGKRLDINMYTDGHTVKGAKQLPLNLLDALRALGKSSILAAGLGKELIGAYSKLRMADWNAYSRHLTEWEREATWIAEPETLRPGDPKPIMQYSVFSLLKNALTGHRHWQPAWREPAPRDRYDVLIIGGGGHGLATAYYLARNHGITNIAVIEKGYLGGGNVGRNTTIVRSNYMLPGNVPFYELSMKLWEGLEQDINYNAMVSQRGVLNLCHSDAQRDAFARRGNAMRLHGVDSELLDKDQVRAMAPYLNFDDARFPIQGGLLQPRGGTVRHDAVAWGYARAADLRGVDIIQNCEVTGLRIEGGAILGVETTRGYIGAGKVGMAVAGNTSRVAAMAGLRLPIESHVLQAFVSEGIKPLIDTVITFGAGHFYISQSDKGGLVFGGDIDGYNSYAQRGNLPTVEDVCEGGMALMPMIGRVRMLRQWGGIMDMSMDGSPFIDKTPIDGLYLNAGWCYGGFKATPASGWCFAHLIARDAPHETAAAYRLDRFATGHAIDEKGQGAQPNLH